MERLCSAEIECLVIPPGSKDGFVIKKDIRFKYKEALSESWIYDLHYTIKKDFQKRYKKEYMWMAVPVVCEIKIRKVMEINPIYITSDDTDIEYTL